MIYCVTFSDKPLCMRDVKMFNLRIEQTEISQKRSKKTKKTAKDVTLSFSVFFQIRQTKFSFHRHFK